MAFGGQHGDDVGGVMMLFHSPSDQIGEVVTSASPPESTG